MILRSLAWGCRSALGTPVGGSKVFPLVCGFEDLKATHERLIDAHHRARVVKLTAIVGRAEKCDELAALEELVAVFNHLMRAANQVKVVFLVKLSYHLLTECERYTAIVVTICFDASFRVRPK